MSKRTSDHFAAEISDDELDAQLENLPLDSCDVVRRKIRTFLDRGEMKVGEFQAAIETNSISYSRFMNQNGTWKGQGSEVYISAWRFFEKRELLGLKMPKTKAKTDAAPAAEAVVDTADVQLEGEMDDQVEIPAMKFVAKSTPIPKKPGVTQAQFLRDVAAQYHTETRKIQSKQLNDFRSKKGAYAGNTSVVFYGAYVFFEKMRVKEGKPKGKKRVEMEAQWGREGGMETSRRQDWAYAPIGSAVTMDQYGKMNVSRPRV